MLEVENHALKHAIQFTLLKLLLKVRFDVGTSTSKDGTCTRLEIKAEVTRDSQALGSFHQVSLQQNLRSNGHAKFLSSLLFQEALKSKPSSPFTKLKCIKYFKFKDHIM